MKQRLTHETQEQTEKDVSFAQDQRTEKSLAFDSPEAMIRYDAASIGLPPQMQDRVKRSIALEPIPNNPAPWWKQWIPF